MFGALGPLLESLMPLINAYLGFQVADKGVTALTDWAMGGSLQERLLSKQVAQQDKARRALQLLAKSETATSERAARLAAQKQSLFDEAQLQAGLLGEKRAVADRAGERVGAAIMTAPGSGAMPSMLRMDPGQQPISISDLLGTNL